MKKIKGYVKKHKIISIIVLSILGLSLLDALLTGDFDNFKSMFFSLIALIFYVIILSFMVSEKRFYCPNCGNKIKKNIPSCPNCNYEFNIDSEKPTSKRVCLASKLFFLFGEVIAAIPLCLGFLYLLISTIVFATNSESMSISNTLFVCYTKEHLLPFTLVVTAIGIILILIGFIFKKKDK